MTINLEILEHALINVINSNDNIRNEATNIIENVSKTNNCFALYIQILVQSVEPNAKNQASTQLYINLKSKLNQIDIPTKTFLQKSLIEYLTNFPNAPKIILNNIKECISLFVSNEHQIWAELNQYIDSIQIDLNPTRISILNAIIHFLDPQFIAAKYQLYCQIASSSIISSNDINIIIMGLSILSVLVSSSKSLKGFEPALAKIISLISQYMQIQNFAEESQTEFWYSINTLFYNGVFPPELLLSIVNFLMDINIPDSIVLLALESIVPVFKAFNLDQIFIIIRQIIFFSAKFIQTEKDIPLDFMSYIENCFTYFPHSQIYEYLKKFIVESLPTNAALSIILFDPIISSAYEQVSKDINFFTEVLKAGFMSGNSLIIESCATVVETMNDYSTIVTKCFDTLFPIILQLLVSPNDNIRASCFGSMQNIFLISDIKNDVSVISALWSYRSRIHPNDITDYFDILGSAINCSNPLDDNQIHEIIQFIQPMLVPSKNDSYALYASLALYVIGQIICHGEYVEIEKIIPMTLEATKYCLSYKNEDVKMHALSYVLELVKSYGPNITEMLNAIWPFINKLISKRKFRERIMELSLSIACEIAKLFKDQKILREILNSLNNVFEKKHYDIFLKCSAKIIKLMDDKIFISQFVRIIQICLNEEDVDTFNLCFQALKKYLKYLVNISEESRKLAIDYSAKLIQFFFEGSLPCLKEKSILNPELDFDVDMVDYFSEFLGQFVSYPSQYVELVCSNALKMATRKEDQYKNFVVQIFIDAIEHGTVPQNVAIQLVENMNPLMTAKDEDIQQNIAYLMIVILKQYPMFITQLGKYLPFILQWWTQCMTNTKQYSLLISNIASLFLRIESMTSSIPPAILEQLMDFFPPSDISETQGMSECIVLIFEKAGNNQQEVKPISLAFKMKTAIGFAKLLTEPAKKLKKMNLQKETNDKILILFKYLCQDQNIMQAVAENLAQNEKRRSNILKIINS